MNEADDKNYNPPTNVKEFVAWKLQIALFLIAAALVISRRPDAIINPQFWAEDGKVWFADAYNQGLLKSLFLPHNGYLHIFPRIIAILAQFVPFYLAPLLFNLVAITIQVLPVNLLMSSRFSNVIPNLKIRLLLSFIYLALPGSTEIHANLTNTQWHLALLAFMVIISDPVKHHAWKYIDACIIMLAALSGPFSIFFIPIILIRWLRVRDNHLISLFLLSLLSAIIQLSCLFLFTEGRPQFPLGASVGLLFNIIAKKVFLIPLVGQHGVGLIKLFRLYKQATIIVFIVGLITIIKTLFRAPLELKLLLFFGGMVFASALVSPPAVEQLPWWFVLNAGFNGGRYWFLPNIAFVSALIWTVNDISSSKRKIFIGVVSILMSIGISLDWFHPELLDYKFKDYASIFEEAPRSSTVKILINPPGWDMKLIKH